MGKQNELNERELGVVTGGASEAEQDDERAYRARCNSCWHMGQTSCNKLLAKAEANHWKGACPEYKAF